ncbi:hypothetical protein SASPL_101105 [Salvia splendens]|uniref:Uncharacterized protein n=1 Tax=Salvia splendens TaxID=180675 RepID=A0A8X8YU78_SALSN|nr:hypothetical protein SASPL_101105 [Salvia splendens]
MVPVHLGCSFFSFAFLINNLWCVELVIFDAQNLECESGTFSSMIPNQSEAFSRKQIKRMGIPSTIAVKYIKKLEHTLQELEKRKMLSLKDSSLIQWREAYVGELQLQGPNPVFAGPEFNTWTSPNVILNVCGRDAQISVCSV